LHFLGKIAPGQRNCAFIAALEYEVAIVRDYRYFRCATYFPQPSKNSIIRRKWGAVADRDSRGSWRPVGVVTIKKNEKLSSSRPMIGG
jgi:hypothetical protein